MQTFRGKNVAILGLSIEGLDSVKFFTSHGAHIACCDRRTAEELRDIYQTLKKYPVSFRLGHTYLDGLEKYDIIVRTPGMSPRLPELIAAKQQGKEITSLTKIFFDVCRAPIIGVTGTKGKGTTSTLIYEMLRASGKTVHLGGNVGTPLLSKVDDIGKNDIVVLELSSFQLEDLIKSPHIAVVLKITQEHLANYDPLATNVHESRSAYIDAKKPVVQFQIPSDIAVLNADDPTSTSFAHYTKGKTLYFGSTNDKLDAFVKDDAVYLTSNKKAELICRASEIKLRGRHNLENIAAATLAANAAGATLYAIQRIARSFGGLPHRLELVGTKHGVLYVNDSFSTVPETAIAAMRSFTEPIILIVGGSEKGSDFTELGKEVVKNSVKAVIVVGMMKDRIIKALQDAGWNKKTITGCTSMEEIVAAASHEATSGDVVLLSPACASFDMFKNYKERGELFRYEVSHL